jgi:epsilon-lactone hydrolase
MSIQSKLFNLAVRNSHLLRGRPKKEVFDMHTSIPAFRQMCEKGAARNKLPENVQVIPFTIEDLYCEKLVPEGASHDQLIFYLHGGGYVSGSCSDHRSFVAKLAQYTGISCFIYEYHLAPENPFPAALNDTLKIYGHLITKEYLPENIVFVGESAGGGLCLASLMALRDRMLALPRAAVAISPWTDLTCSGASYHSKNRKSPAPINSWYVFSKHYAGAEALNHQYISPLFGNMEGLPPMFINAAVDDELFDDGEQFYQKALAAGVNIQFRAGKDMIHCYPLLAPLFPEASEAMKEIVQFVQSHLSNTL